MDCDARDLKAVEGLPLIGGFLPAGFKEAEQECICNGNKRKHLV